MAQIIGNHAQTQITGLRAERRVEDLFLSWGWSPGVYAIDPGYDYTILPDHSKFKGRQFKVQVKGTVRPQKAIGLAAPVARDRLRMYARDVEPVFIVRVAANEVIYWQHAQDWCSKNPARITGKGKVWVRMDEQNVLSDREAFEDYLAFAFANATGHSSTDLTTSSHSLSKPLASRLLAKDDQASSNAEELRPLGEELQLSFSPKRTGDNVSKLSEAINFGLPHTIEIENFEVRSGTAREPVTSNAFSSGMLTIRQAKSERGDVHLYAGASRSVTDLPLTLRARLYRGSEGASVSTADLPGVFDLKIIFPRPSPKNIANLTLGIRPGSVSGKPVKEIQELAAIGYWADQVLLRQSLRAEVDFSPGRLTLNPHEETLDEFTGTIHVARALGRLHQIARVLGSDFQLSDDLAFSVDELGDIDLAYSLLEGKRITVNTKPFEFSSGEAVDVQERHHFLVTSTLVFEIEGKLLGSIPVAIDLSGFTLERDPETEVYRVQRGADGQAWMYRFERSGSHAEMRRCRTAD